MQFGVNCDMPLSNDGSQDPKLNGSVVKCGQNVLTQQDKRCFIRLLDLLI